MSSNALVALASAATRKLPYCGGTLAVPHEHLKLFYAGSARPLNTGKANPDELRCLYNACDAGEMDATDFATKLELGTIQQLLNIVHPELLQGRDDSKVIEAEAYKLNIYGKLNSVETYTDTRSEKMVGSLVISLPTPHEGGALVLRHAAGEEWVHDTSELLQLQEDRIAYVAFRDGVEEEVRAVTSGHRVTLTYRLYLLGGIAKARAWIPASRPHEEMFATRLHTLMRDPSFLPKGGLLAFGLQHKYTLPKAGGSVAGLATKLKGLDAMVAAACKAAGLKVYVKMHYEGEYRKVLRDSVLEDSDGENDVEDYLTGQGGGIVISRLDDNNRLAELGGDVDLRWVTPMTSHSQSKSSFFFDDGGDAWMQTADGNLCLTVKLGKAEERTMLVG